MPRHEFGIMKKAPRPGQVYETYEPELYDCLSIEDEIILPLCHRLAEMDCFWHTLDCPRKGLAYYGITLIPPDALPSFIGTLAEAVGTEELGKLLMKAKEENRFVIHFGI